MINMFTTLISAQNLQHNLTQPNWRIFDCRFNLMQPQQGLRQYLEGHIVGAVYASLDEQLSAPPGAGRHPLPDPQRLAAWLGACGVSSSTQVIAYDDASGLIASRLWWLLRWLGHQAVAVLDGGLTAWCREGGSLTSVTDQPKPAEFIATPKSEMVCDTAEIERNLDAQEFVLLDGRAAARFRGEQEPLDSVAGHIPGALNLPATEYLNAQGCFKSPAEIAALHRALTGVRPATEIVTQCGSGITACQSLLAMEHAGLTGARLYPGSWSAWVRDPARPVATGA